MKIHTHITLTKEELCLLGKDQLRANYGPETVIEVEKEKIHLSEHPEILDQNKILLIKFCREFFVKMKDVWQTEQGYPNLYESKLEVERQIQEYKDRYNKPTI